MNAGSNGQSHERSYYMESSNVNEQTRKAGGIGFWGGILILIIGILVGILGTEYARPSHFATNTANTTNPGKSATSTASISGTAGASASSQSAEWNPLDQMRNMQAEIDQVFQRSFDDVRLNPKLKVFQKEPGYSLSMDVRDMKDRYQVRAFLPDTKASDVKVNLDGNQLKVDVSNKTTGKEMVKNNEYATSEIGHYEEVVQLAGALKPDQMRVQREAHELIITVPKV
jgi:HSP20 family molecular chaperone IbpA